MSIFRRILNTSIFRLSLVYALLFSFISATALIFVYKIAETQIRKQIDTRLQLETNLLLKDYQNHAVEGLLETINFYNNKANRPFYIYALIHRNHFDLTRLILNKPFIKKHNQMIFNMSLGNVVEYVPHRNKEDEVRMLLTILPGGYQLLVGSELKETQLLLSQLFQTTLTAISIIFTLAIIVGSLMAHRMVNRINRVIQTADSIIEGDLSQRIPVITNRNNELDRLSRSLNRMLDKIEVLMQGMQEVTNNLAHDLRNPLNCIRHRLESAQLNFTHDNDYPQLIEDTITDVDKVISTFNALLSIAQIESGKPRNYWSDFSLNTLLNDLSDMYSAVAEEKNITWHYHVNEPLRLYGHRQLIAQLITNLLDNAIKYTHATGCITLSAKQYNTSSTSPRLIQLIIADNGRGIPKKERKQVFKRFYRLDNARSTEGNGLGLSLVKAVADLHEATIELKDNHPGLQVKIIFTLK